jgi:hypothetical protein
MSQTGDHGQAAATSPEIAAPNPTHGRAETALLMLAARPYPDQATQEAISHFLSSAIDWDYVCLQAARHGISALVYSNLCAAGMECSATQVAPLAQNARASANHGLYLMGELVKLVEAFGRVQIDVIPFKGPVLAITAFGNVSCRQFSDLDLFIQEGDLSRACEILVKLGFRCTRHLHWVKAYSSFGHELGFLSTAGDFEVDLQWRFAKKWLAFPIDPVSVWNRSTRISVAGYTMRQPCLEDTLLLLCGHGYRHCWSHLKWITDVAAFIHAFGKQLDWDGLIQRASQSGGLRLLRLGLWFAQRLGAASIPRSIADDALMDEHVCALGEKVMHRLFDDTVPLGPHGRLSLPARVAFHLRARERLRDKLPAVKSLVAHFRYIVSRYVRHYARATLGRHRPVR